MFFDKCSIPDCVSLTENFLSFWRHSKPLKKKKKILGTPDKTNNFGRMPLLNEKYYNKSEQYSKTNKTIPIAV